MPSTTMLRLFSGGTLGSHHWRFFRAGGLEQVCLETADDLRHLSELDLKLWVALSCPVKNLEFDSRTLEMIDTDKDGRVRAVEVIAAVKWAVALLKDPACLLKGAVALPLAEINDATPEGKTILASAKQILTNLGKFDAEAISLTDTSDTVKIFVETRFNGDGVIPSAIAGNALVRACIDDIITLSGSVNDRSGKPGITQVQADAFFTELENFAAWWTSGELASTATSGALPLGDATSAAYDTFIAVKNKINDWFQRCHLAEFDHRSLAFLNRSEADLANVSAKDLSLAGDDIAALPLSHVEINHALNLVSKINPLWRDRITAFYVQVVTPFLGADKYQLSPTNWKEIQNRFAPYEAWISAKKGPAAEKLGIHRVREILASTARSEINQLIQQDLAVAAEVAAIDTVDRLVRYHQNLGTLLRNFVNFSDFYDLRKESIFQAGTLFLDQRSCDLCIRVDDAAAHSVLSNLGKVYLAYCVCTRPNGEKMTVAVSFTQGDADYLMVGRNGVFYDRKGNDWDATITKIVEHPISIRQAFWSPYKKIGKMISSMAEQIAGAADKAAMDKANASVQTTATTAHPAKPAEPPKFDMGMMAALGIVATGIAGAVTGLAAAVLGIEPKWMITLVPLGLMAAISGPSMVIAFLKLRQRTLGPILEANGWAINGRVKINIPLGSAFTAIKTLPENSERSFHDPFIDPRTRSRRRITIAIVIILLAVLGRYGYKKHWFDEAIFEARDFIGLVDEKEMAAREAEKKRIKEVSEMKVTAGTDLKITSEAPAIPAAAPAAPVVPKP